MGFFRHLLRRKPREGKRRHPGKAKLFVFCLFGFCWKSEKFLVELKERSMTFGYFWGVHSFLEPLKKPPTFWRSCSLEVAATAEACDPRENDAVVSALQAIWGQGCWPKCFKNHWVFLGISVGILPGKPSRSFQKFACLSVLICWFPFS